MEVRPGYKQTEVGIIPDDWEAPSVADFASFTSGKGIKVSTLRDRSSDFPIPVFGGNGIAGYTTTALLTEPSVIVGRVGQKCGEVYITDGPAWVTDNALYPRYFRQPTNINYLALALRAAGLNDLKNRNDLPLVTQSIVHTLRVAWPPTLGEQTVIVRTLSDVDALLGGLDRLIAKKHDLKQAVMRQLLTGRTRLPGFTSKWEVVRLGEVSQMASGGTPLSSVSAYYNGGIPWVSISDMTKGGKVVYATERNLTVAGLANSTARMFPIGTVLYAMYASLGECSIAGIPLCTSQAILGIQPRENLVAEFLFYFLVSMKSLVKTLGQQGTQANLNKGMVQNFQVPLPTASEQTAIAVVLSDMDAELEALEQRMVKTRALKQAMIHELLTGKTRLISQEASHA